MPPREPDNPHASMTASCDEAQISTPLASVPEPISARSRKQVLIGVLAVAFVLSRIAYSIAGIRFDASALHPSAPSQVQWQLLPLRLLKHDLLQSLWNLHSQPPLYNLFCGFLIHLPTSARVPVAAGSFLLMGGLLVIVTFLLLVELRVNHWVAFVVGLFVVADPSTVLYENWLSWSYPTAALLVTGLYALVRLARSGNLRWAALAAACISAVVLLDTTFQWPWLVTGAVGIALAAGPKWRRALRLSAIPLLLVAGWYVKDASQFGVFSTSSWLGMNLYQSTLSDAHTDDLERLIIHKDLGTIAAIKPFQALDTYQPRFVRKIRTGVPALDMSESELGVPNFNNSIYIPVSNRYLSEDLKYIRLRPGQYLANVSISLELWAIPGDQYTFLLPNYSRITGYARAYDTAVMLEPRTASYYAGVAAELASVRPPASQLSWSAIGGIALDALAAPVLLVRRRRDRAWFLGCSMLWVTVIYSLTITSFTELGENMRFRTELGSLPVILAVAIVSAVVSPSSFRARHRLH